MGCFQLGCGVFSVRMWGVFSYPTGGPDDDNDGLMFNADVIQGILKSAGHDTSLLTTAYDDQPLALGGSGGGGGSGR